MGNTGVDLGGSGRQGPSKPGQSTPVEGVRRAHPSASGPRAGVRGATNGPMRVLASTVLPLGDEVLSVAAWSERSGVPVENIRHRLLAGWSPLSAVWSPVVPRARLTLAAVTELRVLRARGTSYSTLAIRFGLSEGHIWAICSRRQWK